MAKKTKITDPTACRISVSVGALSPKDYDGLLVTLFKGEKPSPGLFAGTKLEGDPKGMIDRLVDKGEIQGAFREFTVIHAPVNGDTQRVIVMGMGGHDDDGLDRVRSSCAQAARTLRRLGVKRMIVVADAFEGLEAGRVAEAAAEAVVMGLHKFPKFGREPFSVRPFDELVLVVRDKKLKAAVEEGARRGQALGRAVTRTRVIANLPANIMTADGLEAEARLVADSSKKVTLEVHRRKDLERRSMNGILAVGAAGSQPPRLLELSYRGAPKSKSTVALVGKGIIYDSGGLSIKPEGGGIKMKYDMAGAAVMLGVLRAAIDLDLPVNLLVLLPVAENLIDSAGYRCGDVLRMANGLHVEIKNTDAEGRLLLADALAYASEKKVDCIFDAATLTGSVVSALGHVATGVMGNNQPIVDRIVAAGERCSERHWQMPLFPEYAVHIKSSVADLNNLGGSPAQTSSAALFLKHFVADEIPWGHLDMCGTGWIGEDTTVYFHKPYLPKRGPTGFDVRTLTHTVARLAADAAAQGVSIRELLAPPAGETKTAAKGPRSPRKTRSR